MSVRMATIVLLSALAGPAFPVARAEEPPAALAPEVPAPATPVPAPLPDAPGAPDAATARVLYALGVQEGEALVELGLDDAELAEVRKGWEDAARGAVPRSGSARDSAALQRWLAERRATMARRREAAGRELAQAAAKNPGAVMLPSGAVFIPIAAGEGARPQPADRVRLHVRSMLADEPWRSTPSVAGRRWISRWTRRSRAGRRAWPGSGRAGEHGSSVRRRRLTATAATVSTSHPARR